MTTKNSLLAKGVFAIAVVAVAGIVGGINFAHAQSVNQSTKPTKAQCEAAGYRNYGQCVSEWAKDKSGYGRVVSTTINTNNVSMTSNNSQSATSGNVRGNGNSGNASNSSSTTMSSSVTNR